MTFSVNNELDFSLILAQNFRMASEDLESRVKRLFLYGFIYLFFFLLDHNMLGHNQLPMSGIAYRIRVWKDMRCEIFMIHGK